MSEEPEMKVTMTAYVGDRVYHDRETVMKIVGEYMRRLHRARAMGANLTWGQSTRPKMRWVSQTGGNW